MFVNTKKFFKHFHKIYFLHFISFRYFFIKIFVFLKTNDGMLMLSSLKNLKNNKIYFY